jgi:hypothetical protein
MVFGFEASSHDPANGGLSDEKLPRVGLRTGTSERQETADSPSRWVHSLHVYHFRKLAGSRRQPRAFGSIIDLRRYINQVVIRVFRTQNLRRASSWGTSSTILIGGPIPLE